MEDYIEDEKKDYQSKIESLESIVRMLELKAKNASDHGMYFQELYCNIMNYNKLAQGHEFLLIPRPPIKFFLKGDIRSSGNCP